MPYGKLLYSALWYGDLSADVEQPEYEIPDLMRYLPQYYQESREMLKLQGTVAEEAGALKNYALPNLLEQFFIQKATWGLTFWENELGIATDRSQPYVRRREIIQAKLRGFGTATKEIH